MIRRSAEYKRNVSIVYFVMEYDHKWYVDYRSKFIRNASQINCTYIQ